MILKGIYPVPVVDSSREWMVDLAILYPHQVCGEESGAMLLSD